MNNTEQALEHGEHAAHAAHARDPFDQLVTITIALTAAILACVTLLSHRAHNETLALQLEANEEFSKASNTWNHFQAKKNRLYLYETASAQSQLDLAHPLAPSDKTSEPWRRLVQKRIDGWNEKVTRYGKETDDFQKEAEDFKKNAERLREESKHMHHLGDRYDLAELCVELGLVLCSIAVMTKKRNFWYGSMAVTGVGILLMSVGVMHQYLLH